MTNPTDTAKLADEIEALAKAIERAKANPPEPSYHIDGGERSRAFDSYVHDLMAAFAQTAMIRAAAVLAAAAVNHLADELDERDAPGLTDEELDEALRDIEMADGASGETQP